MAIDELRCRHVDDEQGGWPERCGERRLRDQLGRQVVMEIGFFQRSATTHFTTSGLSPIPRVGTRRRCVELPGASSRMLARRVDLAHTSSRGDGP